MKLIAALLTPSATTTKVNYNRKPQLTFLRHFKKKILSKLCMSALSKSKVIKL